MNRFPDAVDTTKGGLVDQDTFLKATCGELSKQDVTTLNIDNTSRVVFSTTITNNNGFIGSFQLTNTTNKPFNNWRLQFSLADNITIDANWNGTFNKVGDIVKVTSEDWNPSRFGVSHPQSAIVEDCLVF